ncbi:SDR family NAD(P)-dependent oxidoreductase [Mycolicibacterium monacense]|uniref:3-ketoacyl-ACP reductase n=1 Tax=Mycolicibacterium monacense TaxID=85693 RepID=A0AAD1MZP1_MYCMB|nr:SDR family NAD(P)-dependent oxidoreductase [Mycolicibacterium monacense]MDA4103653.1 3-ketoacyl-ACP reductase [Mycolicibacterium monacense DSM 44395]ORB12819.1 3-ketoacyl-ACP reductase [Mycolicibacterium monacense DSM 44395]QHP86095.1 SDR family oxidoreductase [Mycolicibacterium monacense DSM 44395]BBZ60951.1 3-ketoacyl-ACP reductase [Mycolicibacterium monacense]
MTADSPTLQTAVVTGAGSGIGRAIATTLAARGWRVIVTDVNLTGAQETVAGLEDAAGRGHEALQLDVTDAAAAARLADDVADRLGLDAWVNNAGVSAMERFVDVTPGQYDRTLDINTKAVFFCGQAAARAMIRTGRQGTIVNTASMAAKQGRVPFLTDYVASKFAVLGLTQAMAYELADHQITVNCVCPGFVATPMQSRELEWEARLTGSTPDAVRQSWIDATPLARLQTPDDVARAVAFLVSDDARFITGEALSVNGGAYMD